VTSGVEFDSIELMVNPIQLIFVLLFAFGVYWCVCVIKRLPDDIKELRENREGVRIVAIIFIWVVTITIAIGVGLLAVPQIILIIRSVYDVFTIS